MGGFCNVRIFHLALKCKKTQTNHILTFPFPEVSLHRDPGLNPVTLEWTFSQAHCMLRYQIIHLYVPQSIMGDILFLLRLFVCWFAPNFNNIHNNSAIKIAT